jgi:mannose-6-phosphate isomerase-like protein (cupin superfamily)
MSLQTRRLPQSHDAVAPDGSEVRLLCAAPRGSMAHFQLPSGAVSRAVARRTVEEVWYILAGRGRMWLRFGAEDDILRLAPGLSLAIRTGAHFQFRCDGEEPLQAIGVTMRPWPGEDEAYPVEGIWPPTVGG